jgi:hypothetical protein
VKARYPQLVTPTKKIHNDEQSARRHIPTVHIRAGHNTGGSSRTTPNLLTTQCQWRFQVEALKTELKHSCSRSSYKTPQNSSSRKNTKELHHAFAGTTAISVTRHNNLLSPATTANRKTNAADISGGTCLHLNHWPPLPHLWMAASQPQIGLQLMTAMTNSKHSWCQLPPYGSRNYHSPVPRCLYTAIPLPGDLCCTFQAHYDSKCSSPSLTCRLQAQ